ncbi:MAG: chromosome segregation protein SMC [Planctomycetota bacterium]
MNPQARSDTYVLNEAIVLAVVFKRIVLQGFKSFADRTEFDFGPGMTTIVGPNGCGKSNVLDAVRWVLGEQSARTLRGRKMTDVIFSGSRSRKPANAASVELTFDNRTGFLANDDAEVIVARVLYHSGESEYRLNGNPCRLKDIRHLFLDTGVGVDAYSIIEQGRVDVLLQANPNERREIFEEAAGISRYRVQRAEAQRKLERTRNNLLRLNDVIEELERRLRSVKLAAGKARRWQAHDTRLRELQASFSLAEYHELTTSCLDIQGRITRLNECLHVEHADLAAHDAAVAEQEHSRHRLDEQIQTAEKQLAGLQSERSTLTERIAQCERRLSDLDNIHSRRSTQVAELAERMRQSDQRLREETTAQDALREAAREATARIDQLKEDRAAVLRQCEGVRTGLEQAKTAAFETVRRSALLHNEQSNLDSQRERLNARGQRLGERRGVLEQELADLVRRRDRSMDRVHELDRRSSELTSESRLTETRLADIQRQTSEVEKRIGTAKEARSATLSRLELLEDLENRLEGVDRGTRAVLEWTSGPDNSGGVRGLVADLLRIDDPRVWILQPVLAGFENHVVVADTYAFLSELAQQAELPGPVRVVSLDRISAEAPRVAYQDAPGFVARAVDWVNCTPEYRVLAEHLLGRVIVVDVIERALALAANAPEGYIFVTLDGRSVTTDGRLTAGAARATAGLISRKAEIRQLRVKLDEIETTLEQAVRQKNELVQRASDAQLRRDELLNEIAGAQKEHAEARTVLARVAGDVTRVEREMTVINGEVDDIRRGQAEIEQQNARLGRERAAASVEQGAQETQIGALESELAEFESSGAALARELTDAMVVAGRISEKRAAGEEALAEQRSQRTALSREQAQAQQEADQAVERMAIAQEELRAAHARQAECDSELECSESRVLQLREQRQALRLRLEECGARSRALQARIKQYETEVHEFEVRMREIEVRRENLVARVRDELALDLAAQYATYEYAEQDWETVKNEIDELRQKIARLGNVNLDALAELEELTPRYENLTTQRDDLLASIERLETLMTELDEESRARFTASFEQVRVNFHELFRKLFGGGKADIILEDPDEPLECGVEIIARPPGKELQSISLLSGGEKTMTAVALLMAVFKSKPSPFAILDEVDAALDETNTERFNTMLQEFLVHSQFVVITHSKRTMRSADVLYGVTMEEPGVSKRVGVRFDNCVHAPSVA